MSDILYQLPPGIAPDESIFSAQRRWRDCQNVRFVDGRPQPIGGWLQITNTGATLTGTPVKMLEWSDLSSSQLLAVGTTNQLLIASAGTYSDVSPGALTVTRWSFSNYGQTLIANPRGGKIYQWANVLATPAAQVLNSPAQVTCSLVTPQRQLLAFGCNEEVSGIFNGRCIRCSDIENITSWTTTPTNNVDEIVLDGATSDIVAARLVGGYIAVWTSGQLFVGTFIGDPSQTYRFDRVGDGCGCLGLDSIVVADSAVYWITPDYQFYQWSPGAAPAPLQSPLLNTFRGEINTNKSVTIERTYGVHNRKWNEIWFFYATGSSSSATPTAFVAYSLNSGDWARGAIPRTAMHQGISFLYGIMSSGSFFRHEQGSKGTSGSPLFWSITGGGQYLDRAEQDVMLRSFWPDFKGQLGTVTVTITMYRYPNTDFGAATGQATLAITAAMTKKDFRLSGRIAQMAFSGDDASGATNTFARIGQSVFDGQPTARR